MNWSYNVAGKQPMRGTDIVMAEGSICLTMDFVRLSSLLSSRSPADSVDCLGRRMLVLNLNLSRGLQRVVRKRDERRSETSLAYPARSLRP